MYNSIHSALTVSFLLLATWSSVSLAQPAASPPDWDKFVSMARYIVHYNDWVSMATISNREPIMGFPFSNVKTVSDGSSPSTARGIPYFYQSDMDLSSIDLMENPLASLSFTLAEKYCKAQGWIAQDPQCPRLLLTGEIVSVEDEEEKEYAKDALFTRYPVMATWPADHGFHFTKLVPQSVLLLDMFGGATDIAVEEFLAGETPEEELFGKLFSV